jgi:hypothetical protein
MEKTYLTYGQTNAAVRKFLKANFPQFKLSVRQSKYQGYTGMVIECPDTDDMEASNIENAVLGFLQTKSSGVRYKYDFVDTVYVEATA